MSNYTPQPLAEFAAACLVAAGSDAREALVVADNLVQANRRGIDSHGLMRLLVYAARVRSGAVVSPSKSFVARETAATALIDGASGWGAVVGSAAMRLAMVKARSAGAGVVVATNSSHFGYAAYYGEMAVREGMIGVALTNATPTMAPFRGTTAVLGTNPISVSVPGGEEGPFVFDGATSVVAKGKIQLAEKKGQPIPLGWALDAGGRPTTDPRAAATVCPLGGYKGYDLAAAVDILCGVLGGGPFGTGLGQLTNQAGPQGIGHFFMALDVAAFREAAAFRRDMDRMLAELRANKPAGQEPVLVAGDPERQMVLRRDAEGIPLPAGIEADLRRLAAECRVPFPEAVKAR